jgi:tRNA-splicing ligase RtcB (3'-phosphate/5'-hydroxy nucleic acid ligase)
MIYGRDLIEMGFKPSKKFGDMMKLATALDDGGFSREYIVEELRQKFPDDPNPLPLQDPSKVPFVNFLTVETLDEEVNSNAVTKTMTELMRTPGVIKAAVMPDACPAGPVGTIPVGGVVASENIHPGMHSADVCCSMACTLLEDGVSPEELLNAVHDTTHFGPVARGRNPGHSLPIKMEEEIRGNRFLKDALHLAFSNLGTQGDGNHFAFVGRAEVEGSLALVTHHGSRGFGAALYKKGMYVAEQYRRKLSPDTLSQNAWIPADSDDGKEYWQALQIVRDWTLYNHRLIHGRALEKCGGVAYKFFWNEHNFVFKRDWDPLYYHAKGATPSFSTRRSDAGFFRLIPMNMIEPILITVPANNEDALGFAPHGAGRNYSRTEHQRRASHMTIEERFISETGAIDARFYSGKIDISELPSAYKSAATVQKAISQHGLATVIDRILPYGCIMAGELDQPWKRK